MTSFRLSELPIPYRSAGASPLGTHEGTVTPPEPPTPPTPTGKVYFSGTSTSVQQDGGLYIYTFDPAGGSNVDDLIAKQVGDELSMTVDGTTQTIAITMNEAGEEGVEIGLGELVEDTPVVFFAIVDGAFAMITYLSFDEASAPVSLTVAEIA